MTHAPSVEIANAVTASPTAPPLKVERVVKRFGQSGREVTALGGVTMSVQAGQFVAVMGASGSGKSTLLHLMAGLTTADEGSVIVSGVDLARMNDRQLTLFRRRHIGLVFQAFNLIPTLTAEENVMLPLMLDGRVDAKAKARAGELLDLLGLSKRRDHRPDAMSGGEQQRVAIGRALVSDPAVVLADEPTGNLDSANSQAVCQILRDLSAVHGKTIVMVTHEPTVAAYASDVAVIKDGRLVREFQTQGMTGDEVAARYQQALRG